MQVQGALQRRRGRRSIVVALAAALSLAATCRSRGPGIPGSTPVAAPTLPAPTGPYSVGTLTLEVAPPGRAEPFTDAPEDTRRFVVQLWYPARATPCVPVPYMDAVTAAAVAEELPPDFAARVRVPACGDDPPTAGRGRLPVVLFSHGFGATRFGSTALLTDLASRGFVVAALHHTYGSRITVFPDGTAVEWREEPWAADDAFLRNAQEWVRDAIDTLDLLGDLERGAAGGARFPLAGRLDRRRLAYVGHSYGGFAAILTAGRDERVRAVVDLDGRVFGDDIPRPVRLQVPLLVLLNEVSPRRADFAHEGTARFAVVRGMPHPGFTDTPLVRAAEGLPPFRHDGMTSVRPAAELATLTREAVGAFLECTLRDEPRACAALDAQLERLRGESAPLSAVDLPTKPADQPPSLGLEPGEPWESSLGMKFVPVPGTDVLFSVWETRVRDFEAFVQATSYKAGEGWRDPGASGQSWAAGFSQTPLHPVTGVSWDDSAAFCRWLTEKERAAGALSAGQELRLPTDAEWSLAVGLPAETGATPEEKDGKISNVYPWGAGFPPPKGSGNYSGEGDGWSGKIHGYADGAKFTAKVGSYTANRLGIYDLGGNVWEWCSDWFNAEQKDRVIRGASFVQGAPGVLLSSHHSRKPPGTRDFFNLGFRCVVTVGASSP